MARKPRGTVNPLLLVAVKQAVGQEDADKIALPVLAWFDAAKRGQCSATGCNYLTTHLIIASYIAARTQSKQFHAAITKAYGMLMKAADRPTTLLDLTTAEYQALRTAFAWYIKSLPRVEVGVLSAGCKIAEKMMGA